MTPPHAVIIGSGLGGLAAAVRLGARGYRVTILERLEQPGGRARVHRQDGFTFDAGPTIITAPFLLEELWQLAGRRLADDVRLRPLSPYYRLRFDDGTALDVSGDTAAMEAAVERLSPRDADGYARFMRLSAELCSAGFEKLGHVPFGNAADMLRVLPALVRRGAWRSVYGLVARHVRDPRLRVALSFHPLLIGGNPFTASGIYGLIAHLERHWGVWYAMGGTGALVKGLCGLIEAQGGRITLGTEVAAIDVEGRRATGVRLRSGEIVPARIVVANGCTGWTYRHLLPPEARRRWTDRRIARARYSMGLFVWYFGTKGRYQDVPHHTILLGPRYRALLRDIFIRHHLGADFSLYLHRPTATDPSVAPEGCDAFYALVPVPNLRGTVDWTAESDRFRRAVQQRLEQTILPGLGSRLVTSRISTPQDFARDYLSLHGAGFGMEPLLTQSAWFRPHNRSEDIENLFLVGAGTHPGAGIPGVLSSARILDQLVPHDAIAARH